MIDRRIPRASRRYSLSSLDAAVAHQGKLCTWSRLRLSTTPSLRRRDEKSRLEPDESHRSLDVKVVNSPDVALMFETEELTDHHRLLHDSHYARTGLNVRVDAPGLHVNPISDDQSL